MISGDPVTVHDTDGRIRLRLNTVAVLPIQSIAVAAGVTLAAYGWLAVSLSCFELGLLVCSGTVAWLSVCRARAGATATVLLLNTIVCLLLGIVAIDGMLLASESSEDDGLVSYSFAEAGGDPAVFLRWREHNVRERVKTRGNMMPDPHGFNPSVPRPGAGQYMASKWWINELGFRGREITREKGDRYRIVALGESTTFGATLEASDRPWPEVLQERIDRELVCDKPVQVINAGIPGFTHANNLARLALDIFPLESDLIISYHGYNGFAYILNQIPTVNVGEVPTAPPRPSRFLTRIESALRVAWFKRRYRAARAIDTRALETEVHLTRYADLYRKLVIAAHARGIEVALATFNMAVTPESSEEAILFYEPVFPDIRARTLANRLHTRLVIQLAEAQDALAIDTSPGLDGAYEDAYVDAIHFTQVGRDRLAASIFDGIRNTLGKPSPGCRHRARSA